MFADSSCECTTQRVLSRIVRDLSARFVHAALRNARSTFRDRPPVFWKTLVLPRVSFERKSSRSLPPPLPSFPATRATLTRIITPYQTAAAFPLDNRVTFVRRLAYQSTQLTHLVNRGSWDPTLFPNRARVWKPPLPSLHLPSVHPFFWLLITNLVANAFAKQARTPTAERIKID